LTEDSAKKIEFTVGLVVVRVHVREVNIPDHKAGRRSALRLITAKLPEALSKFIRISRKAINDFTSEPNESALHCRSVPGDDSRFPIA
jgi:hypothetical protein